jgi:DNA-binding MarR family transcriptional regulator
MHIDRTRAKRDRTRALSLLRLVVDALARSARSVERRTGTTNAQLFLLQRLAEEGPMTVNELAERARTSQSTVSIVIGRLVRAKLVTKLRSDADLRRVVVSLTPAARRLLRHAPSPPAARVLRAIEGLSDAESRALAHGLGALARGLQLSIREPAMLFEASRARRAGD